jgi:2-keto-4-pentenoate hydratase/2-oxohepta-3-ene-1,7-dioic acid hydratase in catechol pathway
MANWIRFSHETQEGFGTLEGDRVSVHEGCMFAGAARTGTTLPLSGVTLLAPAKPSKLVALWNNFHALADKLKLATPPEPLYFIKSPTSCLDPDATAHRPSGYDGRIVFEGELGIVVGRLCRSASPEDAAGFIFGYTCVNDITAADLINRDASFAQWTRAKSFDGFGPLGPTIATGLDWRDMVVRTDLNGDERQRYPVSDMVFSPPELVSRISHDMTLLPGDVICCGTSVGVGAMKNARDVVDVSIDGIGTLRTTLVQ